jgi:hypothetical protein
MKRTDLKNVPKPVQQTEFQALLSATPYEKMRGHCSRWLGYPLCLALLGALGWELAKGGSQRAGSPIVSSALAAEVPQFDCFSSPSIALAILQKEGTRLFSKFTEARDAEGALKAARNSDQDSSRFGYIHAAAPAGDPDSTTAAVRAIEDLEASLARLQRDVTHELLDIYEQENQPEKFLNLYLKLLRTARP